MSKIFFRKFEIENKDDFPIYLSVTDSSNSYKARRKENATTFLHYPDYVYYVYLQNTHNISFFLQFTSVKDHIIYSLTS